MTAVLGRAEAITTEDPFGPGDPLDVARLVRRALAAAGRKALEVTDLVVVTHAMPAGESLRRFARRALGPHGATIRVAAYPADAGDHGPLESRARDLADGALGHAPGSLVVAVCLEPARPTTVLCLGSDRVGGPRGIQSR